MREVQMIDCSFEVASMVCSVVLPAQRRATKRKTDPRCGWEGPKRNEPRRGRGSITLVSLGAARRTVKIAPRNVDDAIGGQGGLRHHEPSFRDHGSLRGSVGVTVTKRRA